MGRGLNILLLLFFGLTGQVQAESISKKVWLDQFELFFGTSFCAKSEFQAVCLGSSTSECKMNLKNLIPVCAKDLALPETLEAGEKSAPTGAKLGRCVAKKISEKSSPFSLGKVPPKCTDLSNW